MGDFNGNDIDDVLWYAVGADADYLWIFAADGGHTSMDVNVDGNYQFPVGDFNGDSIDDIIWYTLGGGADYLWFFRADGSHASINITIDGVYQPLVGNYNGAWAFIPTIRH